MSTMRAWMMLWVLLALVFSPPVLAREMRAMHVQAQQAKQELLEKVAAEKQAAEQAAAQSRARITSDRDALQKAIADLEAKNRILSNAIKKLEDQYSPLEKKEKQLSGQLAEMGSMVNELVGVIRITAKDVGVNIDQNLQSALGKREDGFLKDIAEQGQFPAMEDIRRMVTVLLDDIQTS